jgi:hypothetical protein
MYLLFLVVQRKLRQQVIARSLYFNEFLVAWRAYEAAKASDRQHHHISFIFL